MWDVFDSRASAPDFSLILYPVESHLLRKSTPDIPSLHEPELLMLETTGMWNSRSGLGFPALDASHPNFPSSSQAALSSRRPSPPHVLQSRALQAWLI